MRDLSIGAVFAGHRLEAVLGRGGMGVVYLAMHQRLKHRRALKVISPDFSFDEQFRRRFERESELAASIEHPHVIPIYDAGEDDDQLYIAMRYIDGTDVHELIRERGSLDAALVSRIVTQVASALDAAHARNLVHRDVKPANVLIASSGGTPHSYLTDFGLTKPIGEEVSTLTATGMIVGTLDYIAPEQLEGAASPASDVYALGCLAFHALSGDVPYPQQAAPAKMWAHVNAPPPRLRGRPSSVSSAVARAMAKDPAERFPRAGEFASALAQALDETPNSTAERAKPGRESMVPTAPPVPPDERRDSADPSASTPPSGEGSAARSANRPRRVLRLTVPLVSIIAAGGIVAALVAPSHGGKSDRRPGATSVPVSPVKSGRPTSGGRNAKRAEVARIKRRVVEYGSTSSSSRTCQLETDRKTREALGTTKCDYPSNYLHVVHYRILKVALHGRRARVDVTSKQEVVRRPGTVPVVVGGRETISVVKSTSRGWLVDKISDR